MLVTTLRMPQAHPKAHPTQAYQCVGQDAVVAACRLLRHMLEGAPRDVVQRLVRAGTKIAIIGRDQVGRRGGAFVREGRPQRRGWDPHPSGQPHE